MITKYTLLAALSALFVAGAAYAQNGQGNGNVSVGSITLRAIGDCFQLQQQVNAELTEDGDDDDEFETTPQTQNAIRSGGCALRAHARAQGRGSVSGAPLLLERAPFNPREDNDNNGAATRQRGFAPVETRPTNRRGLAVFSVNLSEDQCEAFRARTASQRTRGVNSNLVTLGLSEGDDDDSTVTVCSDSTGSNLDDEENGGDDRDDNVDFDDNDDFAVDDEDGELDFDRGNAGGRINNDASQGTSGAVSR